MKKTIISTLLFSSLLTACNNENAAVENTPAKAENAPATITEKVDEVAQAKALLLAKWQGPYQGVPAFDKVSLKG